MSAAIAVLNAGSSSIKFAVRESGADMPLLLRGQLEAIDVAPKLTVKDADGAVLLKQDFAASGFDHAEATRTIFATVQQQLAGRKVAAVGHRVVHGGMHYVEPVKVDAKVLSDLDALVSLAPLHQPHNIAPIRTLLEHLPTMPQVACFDTAFHAVQPPTARRYAIPRALTDEGVLRYGFHGLSYEYIARRLATVAPHLADARVIVAHLGNGASLCAMHAGKSVASTMGFTAVEGLMMGTRSGSIDPGVLIWLMDQKAMDVRAVEALLYKQSGLLGVSGISSDMRALRASAAPEAAEAIALFVYRVVREIGSMAAALGGIDALVFTAGIGENEADIRAEILVGCGWLGLSTDPILNAHPTGRISPQGATPEVWVVATDEERIIAEHTLGLLAGG